MHRAGAEIAMTYLNGRGVTMSSRWRRQSRPCRVGRHFNLERDLAADLLQTQRPPIYDTTSCCRLATAWGLNAYRLVGPASYASPGAGLEPIRAVHIGAHPLPL